MFSFIRKRRDQIALYDAIYKNDLPKIQQLVTDGLDLNFVRDGLSPLCYAVWQLKQAPHDRDIVDFLIAHGSSPNKAGNDSLLVGAVLAGDHQLIDLALAAGHDIHFRRKHGTTPFQTAAFRNKPETMKYLIEKGAAKEDFDVDCRWFRFRGEVIQILLDLGVDVPPDAREILLWDLPKEEPEKKAKDPL